MTKTNESGKVNTEHVNNDQVLQVVLAEFQALREEIKNRTNAAFTLLNINITATAAVAGFVLSNKADLELLLILPLLSPALGMLFLDHSYNISNLGNYIKDRLRPLIISTTNHSELFAYEQFVDRYEQKKLLRFIPLGLPLILLFAGFPCAALLFSVTKLDNPCIWSLWIAGLFMVIIYIILWLNLILAPYKGEKKQ